jgi:hypothetical protein
MQNLRPYVIPDMTASASSTIHRVTNDKKSDGKSLGKTVSHIEKISNRAHGPMSTSPRIHDTRRDMVFAFSIARANWNTNFWPCDFSFSSVVSQYADFCCGPTLLAAPFDDPKCFDFIRDIDDFLALCRRSFPWDRPAICEKQFK